MKRLTMKTKPRNLTLSEMWKLYLDIPEKDTPEWVLQILKVFYPNRDTTNALDKMEKYYEAVKNLHVFVGVMINGY